MLLSGLLLFWPTAGGVLADDNNSIVGKPTSKLQGIKRYKVPPEDHLELTVSFEGCGAVYRVNQPNDQLVDEHGLPARRLILVGNRNLGNNLWFVAWHKDQNPRCLHLRTEPVLERTYSCLVWYKDRDLAIEPLEFKRGHTDLLPYRASDGACMAEQISWCTYGQQVLRDGELVSIEEIIDEFYDIRHVLYYSVMGRYDHGQAELREIYQGYPETYKMKVVAAWREGRPRSRYLHNAVGAGPDQIIVLQRHGTVEEIGQWLRQEGAEDGIILDNGGSVFPRAWWPFRDTLEAAGKRIARAGNVIFSAPGWRPLTISLVAFVLRGPPRHEEPPGTVAMAMG